MELYDKKQLNILYKSEFGAYDVAATLTLKNGVLEYRPCELSNDKDSYLIIHSNESLFFDDARGRVEITMPKQLNPLFTGLFIKSYTFPSHFEVEHVYPSKKISPEASAILSNAFKMAQFFNDTCIFSDRSNLMGEKSLILPSAIDMETTYICGVRGVKTDEYLHVIHDICGFLVGGEYYKNGEIMFSLNCDNYGDLYKNALKMRYIFSAYERLNPDECLGVQCLPNGDKVLLAASIDNGIKMREISDFNVYPAIMSKAIRPPYFVLINGVFDGRGMDTAHTTPEPKDGNYLPIFIDWAEQEPDLFKTPKEIDTKNIETESIQREG